MEIQPTPHELLKQVITRHQDDLFRFAFFRTGSKPDAEDIVQEVVLKLFNSGCNLSHVRNVKRYLLRAIANRCTDYLRRQKPPALSIDEAAVRTDETEEDAALRLEYERIARLLEDLPPVQAEVIRMKTSDGPTFAQIANLTGCTPATVKSRFRYGIERLRAHLTVKKHAL